MSEPELNDIDHDLIVALRQRIAELEAEVAQWAEFKQRDVYQALVDARAEVARLNKAMDPIDQECCDLQAKWKAEAQWAAAEMVAAWKAQDLISGDSYDRAKRMLDGTV